MNVNTLIDILIPYCDNEIPINYNSILNTVKELNDNDKINEYDILCNINNFDMRIIKMFEGEPSEKMVSHLIILLYTI